MVQKSFPHGKQLALLGQAGFPPPPPISSMVLAPYILAYMGRVRRRAVWAGGTRV